jgi:hypothetical protein
MKELPAPGSPDAGSSFEMVARARFVPDSDIVPVVTARWLYAGVKQATREMVRVGVAV